MLTSKNLILNKLEQILTQIKNLKFKLPNTKVYFYLPSNKQIAFAVEGPNIHIPKIGSTVRFEMNFDGKKQTVEAVVSEYFEYPLELKTVLFLVDEKIIENDDMISIISDFEKNGTRKAF